MVARADDGFYHPTTEAELVALVQLARAQRRQLRVRGSAHSVAAAIHTDDMLAGRTGSIDVMLDRYRRIEVDEARMQVTVQAGCNLGDDPRDPTASATWERSLLAELERRGWALPDLGGVTHQTISGYLMTGSSGGTVRHSGEDAVIAFRLIDGTGRVREFVRGRDDAFFAVGSSLGLLGIISTVTLQCIPRFHILGEEHITGEDAGPVAWFDDGALTDYLRETDYARVLWWPQRGVQRFSAWQARRMAATDYTAETGTPTAFRAKPYSVFGDAIKNPRLATAASRVAQHAGGAFYELLASLDRLESRSSAFSALRRASKPVVEDRVVPAVLQQFVTLDGGKPQRFWDTWSRGLPMDNQMSEAAMPTTFTEIYVPLDAAGEVMRRLRDHFRAGGMDATGTFAFELYAARASEFWMNPSYGRDSLRVDVFWFSRNPGDPGAFYEQFWRLLAPFGYRLHWGKHVPTSRALGADYLRNELPRWDDFMALRAELDPDGIFLNAHWRTTLGISMQQQPLPLPIRLQRFYERLAVERERALDELPELFASDVRFRDPFRQTTGLPALRKLFERALRQYAEFRMDHFRCTGTDDAFTLTYDMRMKMAIGPAFVTPMASVCIGRNGKIAELIDYYDFASGLVSPLRLLGAAYRGVVNRLFL